MAEFVIKEEDKFKYFETGGPGEKLLLLHGLFGALSNFTGIIDHFGKKYNVIIPILPIFELPIFKVSLTGLVEHIVDFVAYKGFDKVHVLGNSLGGHIAILYGIADPGHLKSLILTGSSGLFESGMGNSFPKRGNYEFIKEKTALTFYDPAIATKELVDEVFEVSKDRSKAIRIIVTAKSAVRHNLADKLYLIEAPTLLVWGKNDTITPPFVGEKFHELIRNSHLEFIDKCGHAPMMEHPEEFNRILEKFLHKIAD
ncbi:MAG: alpha/beta hydrolase [Bacteroidota bacterium]|nr:alpha/beta hydrolase [Bacteroidota bacterium]